MAGGHTVLIGENENVCIADKKRLKEAKVEVKQSRYRPGVAQRVPGS